MVDVCALKVLELSGGWHVFGEDGSPFLGFHASGALGPCCQEHVMACLEVLDEGSSPDAGARVGRGDGAVVFGWVSWVFQEETCLGVVDFGQFVQCELS